MNMGQGGANVSGIPSAGESGARIYNTLTDMADRPRRIADWQQNQKIREQQLRMQQYKIEQELITEMFINDLANLKDENGNFDFKRMVEKAPLYKKSPMFQRMVAERLQQQQKLIEVSPGASLYNPAQGEFVGTAPPRPEKPVLKRTKTRVWQKYNPQTNAFEDIQGQPDISFNEPYWIEDEETGRTIRVQRGPDNKEYAIDRYTAPEQFGEPTTVTGPGGQELVIQEGQRTGRVTSIARSQPKEDLLRWQDSEGKVFEDYVSRDERKAKIDEIINAGGEIVYAGKPKAQDVSKSLLYWQAVKYNAENSNPPDTKRIEYAKRQIEALTSEQAKSPAALPKETRSTDVAPGNELARYWDDLSEEDRLAITQVWYEGDEKKKADVLRRLQQSPKDAITKKAQSEEPNEPLSYEEFTQTVQSIRDETEAKSYYDKWVHKWQ